jgi:hypothetical protein
MEMWTSSKPGRDSSRDQLTRVPATIDSAWNGRIVLPDTTAVAPKEPSEQPRRPRPNRRPGRTRRHGLTWIVLRAGALAGAIGAIVTLVVLFVHAVSSLSEKKSGLEALELSFPPGPQSISGPLTYTTWLKDVLAHKNSAGARADTSLRGGNNWGVVVNYNISAPNVAIGTRYVVTFSLIQEPINLPVTGWPVISVRSTINRPDDQCGCNSPFLPIPHTHGLYSILVAISPADSTDNNQAQQGYSARFRVA